MLLFAAAFGLCVSHSDYLECNGLSLRSAAKKHIMGKKIHSEQLSSCPVKITSTTKPANFTPPSAGWTYYTVQTAKEVDFVLQTTNGVNVTSLVGGLKSKCPSQVFVREPGCDKQACTIGVSYDDTPDAAILIGYAKKVLIGEPAVSVASMHLKPGPPTPPILPSPQPPTPPPTPSPPTPPPTPSAPTPPPSPPTWECHTKTTFTNKIGLKNVDHASKYTIAACETVCVSTPGCAAINIHDTDRHCHTYSGNATYAQYKADLKQASLYQTCTLLHPPSPPPAPTGKWACSVCAHVYDPAKDASPAPAGTKFEDLPDTWRCPVCAAPKSAYKKQTTRNGQVEWVH